MKYFLVSPDDKLLPLPAINESFRSEITLFSAEKSELLACICYHVLLTFMLAYFLTHLLFALILCCPLLNFCRTYMRTFTHTYLLTIR